MTNDIDDCGAMIPDEECGECAACRETTAEGIDRAVETGDLTESEAVERHMANGTWG